MRSYSNSILKSFQIETLPVRKFVLPTIEMSRDDTRGCVACLVMISYPAKYDTSMAIGLLACSSDGHLCYWEDVNLSSTADTFHQARVAVDKHDLVVALVNCEVSL
jgi:hypothetical protein